MFIDYDKCRRLVREESTNYPHLREPGSEETAISILGSILSKRRRKMHVATDIEPALRRLQIPFMRRRGFTIVMLRYFNKEGALVRNGKALGVYTRERVCKKK